MNETTLQAIRAHADEESPRECCGVVLVRKGKEEYWPCRNVATQADTFEIHHEDYAAAEDAGDILTIVHSHPFLSPQPSQADLVACETSGLPWLIMNVPTGEVHEFQPSGYQAPLIGRVFSHGRLDCFTLVRDYYKRELSITLPDFERQDDWWSNGQDLYRDNFRDAGFVTISPNELRLHDAILIQLGTDATNPRHVPNHAAIYLGNNVILHHPMNRLSGRDVYGGMWQKNAQLFLRHKDLA